MNEFIPKFIFRASTTVIEYALKSGYFRSPRVWKLNFNEIFAKVQSQHLEKFLRQEY